MPRKHHGDYEFLVNLIGHRGGECVTWPFARDKKLGRGYLCHEDTRYWAHRLMCELAHGPAPEGKTHAAHNCGNGHLGCVNPRHIEWKLPRDNYRDKIRHGTNEPGCDRHKPRLTRAQVAEIQTHELTQWQYAEKFGISLGGVQYWWRKTTLPTRKSRLTVVRDEAA